MAYGVLGAGLVVLAVLAYEDLRSGRLSNLWLAVLAGLGVATTLFVPAIGWRSQLLGLALLGVPGFLLTLFRPDWLGWGDFKLLALLGWFFGWRWGLLATALAFFLTGLGAAGRYLFRRDAATVPFAPFVWLGTVGAGLIFWLM